MIYFLLFMVAFFVAFLVTPSIRMIALRFYLVDKKNHRKIHTKVVTKMGGVAIYAGFVLALMVAFLFEFNVLKNSLFSYAAIIISSSMILLLGIYDDIRGANSFVKFSVQIVASLILIHAGFVIESIDTTFGMVILGYFSIPFTLLWLIGITNAINLIDGLDGLAAGIVFIISLGLAFLLIYKGSSLLSAVMSIALAGACLGFLRYNYYPAKIFMGDTGSLFLGFMIAILAIEGSCKSMTTISMLVPIIALGVPIVDTMLAFGRRIKKRKHPFKADNSHLHHWLVGKGLSQVQAVWILYITTLFLSFLAFLIQK
ncbi:glycosyltransferase family 4 protein [Candidatus Omnitrophota bacterium]